MKLFLSFNCSIHKSKVFCVSDDGSSIDFNAIFIQITIRAIVSKNGIYIIVHTKLIETLFLTVTTFQRCSFQAEYFSRLWNASKLQRTYRIFFISKTHFTQSTYNKLSQRKRLQRFKMLAVTIQLTSASKALTMKIV